MTCDDERQLPCSSLQTSLQPGRISCQQLQRQSQSLVRERFQENFWSPDAPQGLPELVRRREKEATVADLRWRADDRRSREGLFQLLGRLMEAEARKSALGKS